MCSSFIPSDLLGTSVTTHPYFIYLALKGRRWGEGDSCIRVRAWVLYALYSWMVIEIPDLNVFDFFRFIKNSMVIILPSSAFELRIIGVEPVSNYIVSKRIILPVFCSVPFGLYYLTYKPVNMITLQRQKSIRFYSFFSQTNTPHLNSHHADDRPQNCPLCSQKL